MAEVWVAAAVSAGGAFLAYQGAKKNAAAQENAASANTASQAASEANNWQRFGLQRGVDFNTGSPVNTKMPLWANITRGGGGSPALTVAPASRMASLGTANPKAKPIGFKNGQLIYADGGVPSGASGGNNMIVRALNPAGIGGKNKTWYDPSGIF